jgi:hypothetical protein
MKKNSYFVRLNSLNNVHFHWILNGEQDQPEKKDLIELEYRLRPRITRFIMDRLGFECCEDFNCFHFEVDMVRREVRISDKTPEEFTRLLCVDFKEEISANCC